MAGTTSGQIGLLLMETEPGIVSELNNETPILESFGTGKPIKGKGLTKGIQVNRNRGGYYTAEGGAPPVAGGLEVQDLVIKNSFYHHAFNITKQLMDASDSTEGAFADYMEIGMRDVKEVLQQRRNAALWGYGLDILALINGTASSTTQTLDGPGGIAGADDGARFLNVDDWIGFVNPAGSLRVATAHRVTAVPTSSTITISPTAACTDNDYVVRAVNTTGTLTIGNTGFSHAPMGLMGLVDNGTLVNLYFGKSRTTFPILNATVINVGGAIGPDIVQRAIDVSAKLSVGRTNEIWVEPGVKRAYLVSMQNDRRYSASDLMNPNAGTVAASPGRRYADTGLKFGNIPIFQDHMAPYGHMVGLDTRWIKRHPGPMGWADEDGNVLSRSTTAVDTYDAWFRCFENFSSEKPNTAWKLTGITHDFVAAHVV